MKKNLIVLTVLISVFSFTAQAQGAASKYYGTWEYECKEAPYGFTTGEIVIAKKENKSTATIIFEDGNTNEASSVKIKNDSLVIKTYIEGSYVEIELKEKDSKLVGFSHSDNGTLNITAKKKKE
ncbi:hypothetical protein VOI54_13680 [Tamlana sp. 2201CG12-4]|uniref:hypothetical protein n=1 Tax=Tamlana sp. 2201CG12-4 TaxID=3112582 RepID=UPI002DBD6696|nr:hypothetical protein [Tamlana sp. 2201CG12-4]MEC3908077.1 hypothetical protein [Tamlana sp. 2201CG12-4]